MPMMTATGRCATRHSIDKIKVTRTFRKSFHTRPYLGVSEIRAKSFCRPAATAINFSAFSRQDPKLIQPSLANNVLYRCNNWKSFSAVSATEDSSNESPDIKLFFGTQTGTAQLFAMQLSNELSSSSSFQASCEPLSAAPPEELLKRDDEDILIIIAAVYGTGQPTDNAKDFFEWLMSEAAEQRKDLFQDRKYAVFGLGNGQAFKETFCIIGKKMDARIEELGGKRIHPIGLGDDSECIDDDFDVWSQSLMETLENLDNDTPAVTSGESNETDSAAAPVEEKESGGVCLGVLAQQEQEQSSTFPRILLDKFPEGRPLKQDMFDNEQVGSTDFYLPGTMKANFLYNHRMALTRSTLLELRLSFENHPEMKYEAGDHVWLYGKNDPVIVDAFMKAVGANGYDIIKDAEEPDGKPLTRPYPYPKNLTVYETLKFCVDLTALPSPALTRYILGRKVDYKSYIFEAQRNTLDLLFEPGSRKCTLGDLLYQMSPMQPRYYSVAASPLMHPKEIFLVYRPVKYLTQLGHLREGMCTSYMKSLHPVYDIDEYGISKTIATPTVACGVRSNPFFRLPKDPKTPILLIAGGCGIAPILSFIDERFAMAERGIPLGEAALFLGFRSQSDEVYHFLLERAMKRRVLTDSHVSLTSTASCSSPRYLSQDIVENGKEVYDLLQKGGHIYLCGAAIGFATSCANAIKRAIAKHGNMSDEQAQEYYMKLVQEGRYAEDIAG